MQIYKNHSLKQLVIRNNTKFKSYIDNQHLGIRKKKISDHIFRISMTEDFRIIVVLSFVEYYVGKNKTTALWH